MPKKARISFGRSMPKIDEKNTKSVKMFIFVIDKLVNFTFCLWANLEPLGIIGQVISIFIYT